MKFKLDENIGESGVPPFRAAEHDAETVVSENMVGSADQALIEACQQEQRCLVTLDKEFGNPLIYPPEQYEGIVLLRLPQRGGRSDILAAIEVLIAAVAAMDPAESLRGRLWIAQPDRVREYRAHIDEDSEE